MLKLDTLKQNKLMENRSHHFKNCSAGNDVSYTDGYVFGKQAVHGRLWLMCEEELYGKTAMVLS